MGRGVRRDLRRRSRSGGTRAGGGHQVELTVEGLGARGDGVATLDGEPIYLAQTLPGERVLARVISAGTGGQRGEVLELLQPAPQRVEPPCPHFGPCGGCTLQHFAEGDYRVWKRALLVEALSRRGFAAEELVRPLLALPPATRRRAVFAAERQGKTVRLGFHRRLSHAVEDLGSCLLLAPPLVALMPLLRAGLAPLLPDGKAIDVTATLTDSGIDLLLALPAEPDLAGREALAGLAQAADLARLSLSVEGEVLPLVERRLPLVTLGGLPVVPPPGGFLQPTPQGQKALTDLVLAALPKEAETVADLYAGCGTFTFPLAARGHRVHAVEGDGPALAALERAAQQAGLWGRITAEQRDLERQPVLAEDLEGGDALVFDPPRGGARAQTQELAQSTIPVVVAVSCNPATFARDARTLVDGGYELVEATPVDQFPWSGHLELVALFRR